MHRSRISTFCIDVPSDAREQTEEFWSQAVGRESRKGITMPEYSVVGDIQGYRLLVQELQDGDARIHLDIHTDNLEREVARLIELGAQEIRRMDEWVVMGDPAGVVFCVVSVDADDPSLDGSMEWN